MKINLGSNVKKYDDFLNVDIRNIPEVDIVDNVLELSSIENNSVEHIIAHNILEHVAPDRVRDCLKLWVSKLIVGGKIEIGVPDGELIFSRFQTGIVTRAEYVDSPWEDVIHSIFGNMKLLRKWHGNDAELYMHHTLFNKTYLTKLMYDSGLINVVEMTPNHKDNMCFSGIKSGPTIIHCDEERNTA